MERPHIICHMTAALDGKIIGDYMVTETADKMYSEYGRIHDESDGCCWKEAVI